MTRWSRRVMCIPLGFPFGLAFFVSALLLDYAELAGQGISLRLNWGIICWIVLEPLVTVVLAAWPARTKIGLALAALASCAAVVVLATTDMTLPWHPVASVILLLSVPVLSFVLASLVRLTLMRFCQTHRNRKMWLLAVVIVPILFGWGGWFLGSIYRLDTESKEALYSVDKMVKSVLSMSTNSELPSPLKGVPGFRELAETHYSMEVGPYSFGSSDQGFCWGKAVNVIFDGELSIGCAYCSSSVRFCQVDSLEYTYWILPPQR